MQKIILAMTCFLLSQTLQADGLAGIHRQEDLGDKICMKNHFHSGKGMALIRGGQFAESDAYVRAYDKALSFWSGFARLEYTSKWSSWDLSNEKKVTCKKVLRTWKCVAEAKPCKAKN